MRKHENKLKKFLNMNWLQILIVGLVTTGMIFVNGYINMREGRYAFIPLFWINAILSFSLGISVSKLICKICKTEYLMRIGRDSIVYVCLNQIVIRVMFYVFSFVAIPAIASHLLVLVLTIVTLYWLSALFMKTRLRIFIGKGKIS